jgi:hypothetical protein
MNAARLALSVLLLAAAAVSTRLRGAPLAVAVALVLLPLLCLRRERVRLLAASLPILVFAATLVALQAWAGAVDLAIPLRAMAVFLLTTTAARVAPWEWAAGRLSPAGRLYAVGLFLLFVRHFTAILAEESRRTLRARALLAPALLRPAGFSSLAHALASIFRRALVRAERFYAAQLLNGILR